MSKRAIVSFANSKANYATSLARLSDSLRNNFDGDFISYINEKSLNIPSHEQSNYGFKIAAMDKCIEMVIGTLSGWMLPVLRLQM